jgi:hypothetical protein
MRKTFILSIIAAAALSGGALAENGPATRPSTDSSTQPQSPEQLLNQMLKPPPNAPKVLQPTIDAPPAKDKTSGKGAVAPNTPTAALQREGTFIFDRVGRLTRSADGSQAEFTFEADGKTMKDPPVIILPNLKLMTMEDVVKTTNRDLRFRVTGMLTEYRGRNYLLLEKVLVPPEANSQF